MLILVAGSVFIYTSFQPSIRFADPATNSKAMNDDNDFACYHDRIYLGNSTADALIFGSSRTHRAVDADLVTTAYKAVLGGTMDVSVFTTPWSNPEILYFFFRDYLANNAAPEIALIELPRVERLPPPVPYVHPYFANLAPPYLYLDILHPGGPVRDKFFAVSDFLQMLVRHLDLNISRLLVADFKYSIPVGDNCVAGQANARVGTAVAPRFESFEQLLETELEKNLPEFAPDEMGKPESLRKTYADNAYMSYAVEKMVKYDQDGFNKRHFWRRENRPTERALDYFRRIVALGQANNVKIAFFYMPILLDPPPRSDEVEELANSLGAPIYLLPYRYTRVSYHHYRDEAHVAAEFKPVYSTWFASLIDRIRQS